MNKRKLVALHGLPGSGKDTVADHLVATRGYEKIAFADALYSALSGMTDKPVSYLRDRTNKEVPQDELAIFHNTHPGYRAFLVRRGEDIYQPRTSRYHLTSFGTDYMSLIDPSYWAKLTVARIRESASECVVIPDFRAYRDMREYKALASLRDTMDVATVMLQRQGCVPSGHESDFSLPPYLLDGVVDNSGSLRETFRKVEEVIDACFAKTVS